MSLLVKRTQHAIGQGGFHSSYIYADDQCFSLVFDCGGSTAKHRADVIGPVAKHGNHDWLVVSHLDADHINGIAQLEDKGVKFSNVFLPHVDLSHQFFLMLLKSAGSPTVGSYRDSLDAIRTVGRLYAGAFGRVRIVVPGDRDRGDRPQQDTFPNPNGPESTRLPDLAPGVVQPSTLLDRDVQVSLGASGPRTFKDTQSINIAGKNWEFRFYSDEWAFPTVVTALWALPVLQPLRHAIQHLSLLGTNGGVGFTTGIVEKLKALVSPADANAALVAIGHTGLGVTRKISVNSLLKKLYQALPALHDYNSASLCLYSGPIPGSYPHHWHHMHSMRLPSEEYVRIYRGNHVGWLGMGDAHLKDVAAFYRFRKHYQNHLVLVTTLVLPHHGSRHNYDAERIQLHRLLAPVASSGQPVLVAASDPGHKKFGHPHQEVKSIAKMYGNFHNVNLKADSAFGEIVVEYS